MGILSFLQLSDIRCYSNVYFLIPSNNIYIKSSHILRIQTVLKIGRACQDLFSINSAIKGSIFGLNHNDRKKFQKYRNMVECMKADNIIT